MPKKFRVGIILLTSFALTTYLVAWSPLFMVRKISTDGIPSSVDRLALISSMDINIGDRLSRIDPRSIERSLEEVSWVKSASLERHWTSGEVTLVLKPKIAVGIYKGRAIDSQGSLFDSPEVLSKNLPIVTAANPKIGLVAVDLFAKFPDEIKGSTLSVSASANGVISTWQQFGSGRVKITWGSARDIDLKVSVLKALLQLPENSTVKRVDLSAPHAPIVR